MVSIAVATESLSGFFVGGNFLGGFIGNEITENFNNMDIDNPEEKKNPSDILSTSVIVGSEQAVISVGPIAELEGGAGLSKGDASSYIAKLIGKDLNFMSGIATYVFADQLSKLSIYGKGGEGKN